MLEKYVEMFERGAVTRLELYMKIMNRNDNEQVPDKYKNDYDAFTKDFTGEYYRMGSSVNAGQFIDAEPEKLFIVKCPSLLHC